MGGDFSRTHKPELSPDSSIPRKSDNAQSSSSRMSSPEPKTVESGPESKTLDTSIREPASDSSVDKNSSESKNVEEGEKDVEAEEGAEKGEGEEDEGECGFCVFMKGGGCRDSFVDWENCIQEAEKNNEDIVEKCFEVTGALKKCMEAHAEYYEPLLRAEKAAEEEFRKELGKEKKEEGEVADKGAEKPVDSQDSTNQ